MFIKSRVLYTISTQQFNSKAIFNDLKKNNLLSSYFPDRNLLDDELINFLNTLPDGVIFAKKITLNNEDTNSYFIALPFFSSHLKIPLKVGEHVWIYVYDNNKSNNSKLKEINSYWFSRIHALNYTEDVNYSYNDRDFLLLENNKQNLDFFMKKNKKAKQKQDAKEFFSVNKNNKIKPLTSFGDITYELNQNEKKSIEKSVKEYSKNIVPKQSKNDKDLVLQGSDNTMIKFTASSLSQKDNTSTGEIQITSGAGSYFEKDYEKITGFFYDTQGSVIKDYKFDLFLSRSTHSPDKIEYNNSVYSYLNRNIFEPYKDRSTSFMSSSNQGNFNILENASSIIVSEKTNYLSEFKRSHNSFTNNKFVSEVYANNDLISNLKDIEGRKNAKFTIKHAVRSFSGAEDVQKDNPSINMISSNINIFSRKDNSSINIIKEYEKSYEEGNSNAYFSINKFGDAYIDANRIFIGSYECFAQKNKNLSEENITPLIHLGESKKSQSLVLGDQLKEYLSEMLDVSREDMQQTKDLFLKTQDTFRKINTTLANEIDLSINSFLTSLAGSQETSLSNISSIGASPVPGTALLPVIGLLYSDITSLCSNLETAILNFSFDATRFENDLLQDITDKQLKREEELSLRLKNIEDNIDKILSKICKTS